MRAIDVMVRDVVSVRPVTDVTEAIGRMDLEETGRQIRLELMSRLQK